MLVRLQVGIDEQRFTLFDFSHDRATTWQYAAPVARHLRQRRGVDDATSRHADYPPSSCNVDDLPNADDVEQLSSDCLAMLSALDGTLRCKSGKRIYHGCLQTVQ